MSEALMPTVARPEITRPGGAVMLPAVIVDAGPAAVERFLEFFAARIANARTRAAYGRAVGQFLAWCEARGLGLTAVSPLHVAAYIRTHPGSAPTVKQHLAAIRMLGDWLVVSQVLPVNPAAAVRGPKHVVTTGATPVLSPAEARRLLAAIDTGTLAGLRDRALVSVMLYSFARVSAVIGMRRQDYFRQERQGWLRLHEKGGQRHDVPAHHRAAEALDDYLARAGLDAASRPGDDQAAGGGGGSPALDLLPHVSGNGDHSVSVKRGDARARAADRRARLPEDDEALRPDSGHDHRRRDRAHRDLDLGGGRTAAPRGTSVRRVGTDARPEAESATAEGSSGRYNQTVMSIQVAYRDGVFKPLEEVAGAEPGAIYTAFSKEELRDFIETVGWLKAAEKSFEFWDNPADAVYDTL